MKYVLVHGGPGNGFTLYGDSEGNPFNTEDDAIHAAEQMKLQDNWWVMPIRPST